MVASHCLARMFLINDEYMSCHESNHVFLLFAVLLSLLWSLSELADLLTFSENSLHNASNTVAEVWLRSSNGCHYGAHDF